MIVRTFTFYIFISFALLSLLSNKCEEENSNKPVEDSLAINKIENSNDQKRIDSIREIKEANYLKKQELLPDEKEKAEKIIKENNLSKEIIAECIPDNISGFTALPNITGKTQENDNLFTVLVKKQFKDKKNNRSIVFDIYDYGSSRGVINKKIYENLPTDLDAPTNPITISGSKGFFYWIDSKKYGHAEIMVDGRFVIVVRLGGFDRNDKILEDYLKLVNINKLLESAKK